MTNNHYNENTDSPWVQPDPVEYGTPNIGYETINKHSEKISALLFIFILICSVITCKAFYEYGQENEPISTRVNTSSTVIHHGSNDGFDFFHKRYEIDPKVKTLIDSMEQAEREKRLAMEAEEREKRKQFMRDSILTYVHMRDSIRHEILRQDSIRMELERQRKAQIEYIAVIDDGITKRTINVNTVSDTLPETVTEQLGKAFETMTLEAVRERQKEIDRTKDYYKHLRLPTERIL